MNGIILTLIAGSFFILGNFIAKMFKKKDSIYLFSIGIAFITLLGIVVIDLIPEIIELFGDTSFNIIIICGFIFFGFAFLTFIDSFSHHHEDNKKEDHHNHSFHIGFVTSLVIILHNILEGFFIGITSITNFKVGFILAISIGLHNLPLAIGIASSFEISKKTKVFKIIILTLLVLSTFIGGIIGAAINNFNYLVLGSLLSITVGMMLYIVIFELLKELINNRFKRQSIYGVICGTIIIALMLLF